MVNFRIEVPFFPGFYESELYNNDMFYNEVTNENLENYRDIFDDDSLTSNDLDIDFETYRKDCCEKYVDSFYEVCPEFVNEVNFAELVQPRYYNYDSDKLYVDIEFSDDWKEKIISFMVKNKEWLSEKIKADWSDRSGFLSLMDNDFQKWFEIFKVGDNKVDARYISVILGYMLFKDNSEVRWSLSESVLESIYLSNYIINIQENKEE